MHELPFEVVHTSEMETDETHGHVRYPVRERLDVQAFGVNLFYAPQAGDELIEEHEEVGGGSEQHEELYCVTVGRATFTLNGEAHDAPAGTFVFVRDPQATRGAVAAEPGTAVLAVGGRRGEAYRVAPWEFSSRAHRSLLAGDVDGARRAYAAGLALYPTEAALLYNLACLEATHGEKGAALEHLQAAVQHDHRVTAWAEQDADLDSIRAEAGYPFNPPPT